MSFFALRLITLFILLTLLFRQEFRQRRERSLRPQNLKDLFDLGAKWKVGSDKRVTALFFASSCVLGFSLWESLMLESFNFFRWWHITWLLGLVGLVGLLRRRQKFSEWSETEFFWAYVSVELIAGAFFCWIFFPWVYFRARFLKK